MLSLPSGVCRGAIPAQAGSTNAEQRRLDMIEGHPRAGGEHTSYVTPVEPALGPSPRRRGAQAVAVDQGSGSGGHPRAGGEHTPTRGAPVSDLGPSPRRRGAQDRPSLIADLRGPSPRRRGALRQGAPRRVARGAIPAQAGSTRPARGSNGSGRGHPRAGGEHSAKASEELARRGPSPRRRGAHPSAGGPPAAAGAIPAQAGSTWSSTRPRSASGGHPRAGGEHSAAFTDDGPEPGPSPRRRGALVPRHIGHDQPGAIPAQAGSTCAGR